MKASQIAAETGGRLEGGADPELTGVAPLDRAGPAELSFVAQPRYLTQVGATRAGALLVSDALAARVETGAARIVVPDVHRALAAVLPVLVPEPPPPTGIDATVGIGGDVSLGADVVIGAYAVIGANARIGDRVRVGPHVVIGDGCVIGDDAMLHPHVVLYAQTSIGARTILHSGVRIGVDGFGYAFSEGGHRKIPQVGRCTIGADVEIGANTTIDRGSIGATEIGDGVKIDNLVHIGHNVRVGAHSVIVAQVGVAGSTTIGRGVTLAGQAGIPGHISIGDGARVGAQAGVFGDIPPGETWSGYPARPHRESLRMLGASARLPKVLARITDLERELKRRLGGG